MYRNYLCCAELCCLLPQVVRVDPAPAQEGSSSSSQVCVLLPQLEAIPDAPDWAKPNRGWVQQFVADFQQLRLQVQQAYEQQGGWLDRSTGVAGLGLCTALCQCKFQLCSSF
jgi:hypothetical protein